MTVVEKQRSVRAVVIHIEGPLRVPMIGHVRHKVAALLRRGERKILLNLAQVSDLDAAGVGELLQGIEQGGSVQESPLVLRGFP